MKDLSNENIIHINKDGIQYVQFRKLLEYENVKHAFSLGIDRDYRTSKQGKSCDKAIKDYEKLCEMVGCNYMNIVKPNQKHTKNVQEVTRKINKNFCDINLEQYNETDGVITNSKDIVLATTSADCILLLFYDPVKKVIGNTHSGWRGTLQQISTKTVQQMIEKYQCNSKDIICCICPSIRKCHFEVREDVEKLFYNEFKNLENIDEIITKIPNTDKWYIDTVKINIEILQQIGLKKENIIDSGICTVCNSELMHSYRVEKEKFGLNTAIIELKEG